MKKVYEITIATYDFTHTITMVNPSRRWLKVGKKEYSGAEIIAVKRIK